MTQIYIILAIALIVMLIFIIYYSNRFTNLENLSTSTAQFIMESVSMMSKDNMRLIDANKLKNELHKLQVFGVLKEADLNVVNQCVDDAPTVFEFKELDDGKETDSDL